MCPTNGFEKKVRSHVLRFFLIFFIFYFFFKTFFQTDFMYSYSPFTQNLRTHFKNSFFPDFFSYFLCKAQNCLETLRVKLHNANIYPLEVQLLKNIFFSKTYISFILNAKLVLMVPFERYQGEKSGALQITIFLKVSSALRFREKGVGNHFCMAK